MALYDSKTLWLFKMDELKTIIEANNIPKPRRTKRDYVEAILRFQGNLDSEKANIKIANQNKNTKRVEYINNLLITHKDENMLKKLKNDELVEMIYKIKNQRTENSLEVMKKIDLLTGKNKKNALVNILIENNIYEATKYQSYYVYPGHWFRNDSEIIASNFHGVKCELCCKQTGIFKKQFNICYDCHLILQTEFCRRYNWLYILSVNIRPHRDILSVVWKYLKLII